jgi:hypothetical protein
MGGPKLSSRQVAQVEFLDRSFAKVQRLQSLIEKLSTPSEAETAGRSLARLLDELKVGAASISLGRIADSVANMSSVARRTGAIPQRVKTLREGLAGLKVNWEGARKAASTPDNTSNEAE